MFFRVKSSGPYRYLQLVENHREEGRVVQRVRYTLGRADELAASGGTDSLLRSLARFSQRVQVVEGYQQGQLEAESEYLLGLASRAHELFVSSEGEKKRQILKLTLQNLELDGKRVRFELVKPFDQVLACQTRQGWLPE